MLFLSLCLYVSALEQACGGRDDGVSTRFQPLVAIFRNLPKDEGTSPGSFTASTSSVRQHPY